MPMFQLIACSVFFVWLATFPAAADVLYTWQDDNGTLFISKEAPPEDARHSREFSYEPKHLRENNTAAIIPDEIHQETLWLKTVDRAKRKRQEADIARQNAEAAIETANRIKRETEQFLEPWRTKTRIKQEMLNEINRRIQVANAAIEQAERLIRQAITAEQTAQDAAQEARQAEKELFEQYQSIVSSEEVDTP